MRIRFDVLVTRDFGDEPAAREAIVAHVRIADIRTAAHRGEERRVADIQAQQDAGLVVQLEAAVRTHQHLRRADGANAVGRNEAGFRHRRSIPVRREAEPDGRADGTVGRVSGRRPLRHRWRVGILQSWEALAFALLRALLARPAREFRLACAARRDLGHRLEDAGSADPRRSGKDLIRAEVRRHAAGRALREQRVGSLACEDRNQNERERGATEDPLSRRGCCRTR